MKSLYSTFGQRITLVPFEFIYSSINETGIGVLYPNNTDFDNYYDGETIPKTKTSSKNKIYTLRFDLYGRDYCLDVSFLSTSSHFTLLALSK